MLINDSKCKYARFCGYSISEEKNNIFNSELDNIDLGGKKEAEYRDAKLVILANYYHPDNDGAQISVLTFGRILIYGVHGALKHHDTLFLCTAAEKLGVSPVGLHHDIKRNRAKIENLRPVMMELGHVEIEY